MRYLAATLLLCFKFSLSSFATHNRAGEITYRQLSALTYEVTITTYTKIDVQADRDELPINWGDGDTAILPRIDSINLGNQIRKNIYQGIHTYSGPFVYTVSTFDQNRNEGILNVNNGASGEIAFYIESKIFVLDPATMGFNTTPVLLQPPVDFGNIYQVFTHNPNAYDADGDSLTYELIPPKQSEVADVPLYKYPDEIEPGPNNIFTLDSKTGEIVWNAPQLQGEYNIAILIKEYRNGFLIGTIIRDMQIRILNSLNRPPVIQPINDTCVEAGALINKLITATDPDVGNMVTLTATGGAFLLTSSPAEFNSVTGLGIASSVFNWQTECEHIQSAPYTVVFKAEDDFPDGSGDQPLTDLETWTIKILAPPPQNLLAQALGNTIVLTWDSPYVCVGADNFRGFSIYRKEGCDSVFPNPCEIGLAGRGYEKIAQNIQGYTFTDNNVQRGITYAYVIVAEFSEGTIAFPYNQVQSIASNTACEELNQDIPLIINVSVEATSTSQGIILLKWKNPKIGEQGLDTIQNPPPYKYVISRSVGNNGSSFIAIDTIIFYSFNGFVDTIKVDSFLNTTANAYSYKIDFYATMNDFPGADIYIGTTPFASSVYVSIMPSDNRLDLSWNENVPWQNFDYIIYKQNRVTNIFESIDTVNIRSFSDIGLINDTTYCYYIESRGIYSSSPTDTLINKSQIACEEPVDSIPPCAPLLQVTNDCDNLQEIEGDPVNFKNTLTWNNPNNTCADDVVGYSIYYSPFKSGSLTLLNIKISPVDTTFEHTGLVASLAGCYGISAIDSFGNESPITVTCIENCPLYELPNVFTPNGDNINALFIPIKNRFIDHVNFKVFNRWGEEVFSHKGDPEINWNGDEIKSGKPLTEGVYYYTCEVYAATLNGIELFTTLKNYIKIIR